MSNFAVQYVALSTQQHPVKQDRRNEDCSHGMLFTRGYNDKLLLRDGQLETRVHYLNDNPRRLLMKREHPDMFRVQRNVEGKKANVLTDLQSVEPTLKLIDDIMG